MTDRLAVDRLRRLAGELQAGQTSDSQWLGRALLTWLHQGGDLADRLGVKPSRGSKVTAQLLVRQAQQDRALRLLSDRAGSDARAARVLQGREPCPPECAEVLEELRLLEAPASLAALRRARQRTHIIGEEATRFAVFDMVRASINSDA